MRQVYPNELRILAGFFKTTPAVSEVCLDAAGYIEHLERELCAAGANVDHMRGVVTRQISLRVEAQARAGRLSRDARR